MLHLGSATGLTCVRLRYSQSIMKVMINSDLDFYSITLNCLFIPLAKLLKNGFNTGHGTIRQPQNIKTAANLACIVLQSNQNEMFKK